MAIDSPRGFFVYELGVARNLELAGTSLYSYLKGCVTDPELKRLLTDLELEKREVLDNVNACMAAISATPQQLPSPIIDGLRTRFTNFLKAKPSTQAVDLYALGIAARIKNIGVIAHEELLAVAELLDEPTCKHRLATNLARKQEFAARIGRFSSEMRRQLLATAPA